MVRGRALVRFLIVFTLVTGMMLAPVVTWPSSGLAPDDPSSTRATSPVAHLDEDASR